jgi:hypothetical protein
MNGPTRALDRRSSTPGMRVLAEQSPHGSGVGCDSVGGFYTCCLKIFSSPVSFRDGKNLFHTKNMCWLLTGSFVS